MAEAFAAMAGRVSVAACSMLSNRTMTAFKRIMAPTDLSPASAHAVDMAVDLALKYGAALSLVHVYELPSYLYTGMMYTAFDLLTPLEEHLSGELAKLLQSVRARGVDASSIFKPGFPADEIMTLVEETHSDLIVIGTHGRRGFSRVFLGSVAEKVVRMSPVPVLTVRGTPPP